MADTVPPSKWSDLSLRVASAAALIPAVILDVWAGGAWFVLLVALLGVLVAYEWCNLVYKSEAAQFALHAGSGLAGALLPLNYGVLTILVLWAVSAALAGMGGTHWKYAGVPYAGFPAAALVLLRGDQGFGFQAIIWVMVIVWAADTLAYFAGRIIGGPKLAPILSPKKTWAGLGGAIAGSAFASIVFALFTGLQSVLLLAGVAALLAIVEQGGDLFKSALKRHYGVKDSGNLIPGHGGVIDRVDGLIAVAIAAALIGLMRSGPAATGAGLLVW